MSDYGYTKVDLIQSGLAYPRLAPSDTLGNVSATAQFEDNAYRDTSAYYLSQGPAPIALYKSNILTL